MGAKKKKKFSPNEGTPFDELERELEKELEPIDLQSKIREFELKRDTKREAVNGSAILYDLQENLLSKGHFRDLSSGGVSFEISSIDLETNEDIFVDFNTSLNLGMVQCTVQWVKVVNTYNSKKMLVGLKFKKLTALKQKLLNEYIEKIQHGKTHDPFYGG